MNRESQFHVLLTSVDGETLLPFAQHRDALPRYSEGPEWTISALADLDPERSFDLTIVVCDKHDHLVGCRKLAHELRNRRETVVLFVPPSLIDEFDPADDTLTVRAPCGDLVSHAAPLVHTLLAGVLERGLVCVDWADILTVIDDGSRALLLTAFGQTPAEAVRQLAKHMERTANRTFFGATGALYTTGEAKMSDYLALFDAVAPQVHAAGFRALTLPTHSGKETVAAVLALTSPSKRFQTAWADTPR